MANMVKFWKGLKAKYTALATKDAATLYFITDTQELYLGATLIADATGDYAGAIGDALKNYYTKSEVDAFIAGLDATIKGEGTYVDVTVTETDGKITAVVVDDSAIDTKLADYQPKGDYQPAGDYKTKQEAIADKGLTGAKVLAGLSQDDNGVITYTTRDLTPANIGAEAAGTAAGLIAELDVEKSSAAVDAGKGIQVTVKEVDGKIDAVTVTGNYDNTYDAKGAAATAEQNAKDYSDGKLAAVVEQYLTGEGAADTIDTLNEIADWINSDEAGATKIIADIATNTANIATNAGDIDKVEAKLNGIAEGDGTVKAAIDAALAEAKQYADNGDDNTIYDDTELSNRVKANEDKLDGITTTVKAYVDAEIDKVDAAGIGTALDGKVDKVKNASGELAMFNEDGNVVTTTISKDAVSAAITAVANLEDNKQDNLTEAQLAAVNSGIDAAKVTGYDATKKTVDDNKTTWDKAGTAVQRAGDTMSGNLILLGPNSADYNDSTENRLSVYDDNNNYLRTEVYSDRIAVVNSDFNNSLTLQFVEREAADNPFETDEEFGNKVLTLPAKNGTLATTDDATNAAKAVQGNTTATVANVVEAVNKLADGQATTDGALRDANSNINELLTALTWIEG